MQCDMCGVEEKLYRCKIEDTILQVCKNCSVHGKIIEEVKKPQAQKDIKKETTKETIQRNTTIQIINPNYSKIIKEKREKTGLKQKELAQKIGEKESVIHKVESSNIKPSISLARKFEKFLKIKLVEQQEEKTVVISKETGEGLTLGDFIKVKKK